MSKVDKLITKLLSKPTPNNFRWNELQVVMSHFGYEQINGGGSRRKFIHTQRKYVLSVHEPHPHSEVDRAALNDAVEHLRMKGFI